MRPREQLGRMVLADLRLFERLLPYTPFLAGTIPLGVDLEASDLDILCEAHDLDALATVLGYEYGGLEGFTLRQGESRGTGYLVCGFLYGGFAVEVFAQPLPVQEQYGWLHFEAERRLLALVGDDAREAIRELKRSGLKTEPAFAHYFGLTGDPYEALAQLAGAREEQLVGVARTLLER